MHMAQMMIDAIKINCEKVRNARDDIRTSWLSDDGLSPAEVSFTRLGALVHDIGHLANGHTFEDELGLLAPHDADERIMIVFGRQEWHGQCAEPLGDLINHLWADAAAVAIPGRRAHEIVLDLISKDRKPKGPDPEGFRASVCRDIIGNTLCADLLDYLHRDWHHIGKPRTLDLRVLDYVEIRRNDVAELGEAPRSRLVVNLRGGGRVRTDAVTAILDLLESRYQLGEIALFHRTKNNATAMLERVVSELADALKQADRDAFFSDLVEQLLSCDDREMLSVIGRAADELIARRPADTERLAGVRPLLQRLRLRRLHKLFGAWHPGDLPDQGSQVQSTFGGDLPDAAAPDPDAKRRAAARAARNRLEFARRLEDDFGLSPGSVAIYCPPGQMNTKIAEVQVLVDGEVRTLDKHEERSNDGLTGGHLAAQRKRFRRLWRVHIAIDPDSLASLKQRGLDDLFERQIAVVLGKESGDPQRAVHAIARELTTRDESPWRGRTAQLPRLASRGDETSPWYPGGVPSVRSCFD
jgi:HD superfamily phosphohydrolase